MVAGARKGLLDPTLLQGRSFRAFSDGRGCQGKRPCQNGKTGVRE